MRLELNVGLWINGRMNANHGVGTVLRDLVSALGNAIIDNELTCSVQTATTGEPTAVITIAIRAITQDDLETRVNFLSRIMGQDCIAGKIDGAGFLYGPNTAPYGGAFNPDYWLAPR